MQDCDGSYMFLNCSYRRLSMEARIRFFSSSCLAIGPIQSRKVSIREGRQRLLTVCPCRFTKEEIYMN